MQVLIDYRKELPVFNNICYLLGISKFSYNISETYSLCEIKEIIRNLKEHNNQIIINLEKIMYDEDLNELLPILKELEHFVDYITYSDLGVFQLIKENNLNIKVIYHASTMITNLNDILFMLSENDNIILGKEISFEELLYIDSKLNKKVFIDAFGKFPIFYSRRHLLSTYLEFRNIDINPNDLDYSLVEEFRSENYPIVENDGTIVYESSYYCLGTELKSLNNIGCCYLSSNFISLDDYEKIINCYLNDNYSDLAINEIVPIYKGKLSEKTILIKGGIN